MGERVAWVNNNIDVVYKTCISTQDGVNWFCVGFYLTIKIKRFSNIITANALPYYKEGSMRLQMAEVHRCDAAWHFNIPLLPLQKG